MGLAAETVTRSRPRSPAPDDWLARLGSPLIYFLAA
jgi:hypothetical protein